MSVFNNKSVQPQAPNQQLQAPNHQLQAPNQQSQAPNQQFQAPNQQPTLCEKVNDNNNEKNVQNNASNRLKLATAKTFNLNTNNDEKRTKNGKFTLTQLRQTEGIVPLQSGTNQYDSQKGMTSFGMPRDVKGKHLKRIWELEFPDEALN